MALGLLAGAAKGVAKNVAKDRAKSFITGKKKTVKPGAIKKSGGGVEAPGEKGGALVVRPQTSMVPSPPDVSAITPISGAEMASTKGGGEEDIINVIRVKVIEIDKVLKGTLAQQKTASKKDKKSDEKQRRKKQEKLLEKVDTGKKDRGIKKLGAPAKGLFGGIFDFLKNILIGRLLVVLLESKPNLPGGNLLTFLAGTAEKIIDVIIGVIDALGSFLAWGQEKLDGIRSSLVSDKGEEAGERFDGLLSALTNLFNATVIVGSVFGALGAGAGKGKDKRGKDPKKTKGPKKKVKPDKKTRTRRASKEARKRYARRFGKDAAKQRFAGQTKGPIKGSVTRRGLGKVPGRVGLKVLGKGGVQAMKGIAKGFSRIPIVGPLIVAVSSLLAGEPLGQAAFKGVGAALGGLLGSFIPIPVIGTLLGEAAGVFVGDLLYSLILGGGPEEAGQKFMNVVKTALDAGGLIVNFFKEGFGRFFADFPVVDIPAGGGVQTALGKIAGLIGLGDNEKFMQDGRLVKMPNLSILFNPVAMVTELIPHAAKSFFPGIFGADGTAFGGSGSVTPTEGQSQSSGALGSVDESSQIPMETNASVAGATGKGMQTGPAGYDRIGAGAAYHVDTKFHKSIGMGGMIAAMDKLADEYTARGKEIVFSGQGYARLKAYKSNLSSDEKRKLMQSAIDAHSHSKFMRAEGFLPFDYYIPDISANKDLYHPSTEGAEILLPDMGGDIKVGAHYGGYGKSANIFDGSGKMVAMTGHGDLAYQLGGFTKAMAHRAVLGEKGREFVIDADSTAAIEAAFPGLLSEANLAKGAESIGALMAYTSYEEPAKDELVMTGGSGGGSSYGESPSSMPDPSIPSSSDSDSSWKDIRYKFG
tara:strand:- start:1409 stop:4012 length:2604 start_codon:yes stop_codon:yes gene_type:complete